MAKKAGVFLNVWFCPGAGLLKGPLSTESGAQKWLGRLGRFTRPSDAYLAHSMLSSQPAVRVNLARTVNGLKRNQRWKWPTASGW